MTSEVEERPREGRHGPLWRLGSQWVNKKAKNPNFAEFLAFWGLFGIGLTNLSQKDPSFGKLGHVIKQRQRIDKGGSVTELSACRTRNPAVESRSNHYLDLFLGNPEF